MYYWRVFLWENGHKSTEYTDYAVAPIFLEDKLDETLDSGEIILKNMPRASRDAFPPKTKFRLERYITEQNADTPKTWDLVVDHDDVEEYECCPEICTHRIYLTEASVIAQGMHVDNIALTYELQDVTLNYKTVQSITDTINDMGSEYLNSAEDGNIAAEQTNQSMASVVDEVMAGKVATVYFNNSYRYVWRNYEDLRKVKYKYYAGEANTILFNIPTLIAQAAINGQWVDICEVRTTTQIIRKHYRKNTLLSTNTTTKNCGPATLPTTTANENVYTFSKGSSIGGDASSLPQACFATIIFQFASQADGALGFTDISKLDAFSDHLNKNAYRISQENASVDSKAITIKTDVLTDNQLAQGEYFEYEIITTAQNNGNTLPAFYECKCDVAFNQSGNFANSTSGLFGNKYQGNGTMTTVATNSIYVNAKFTVEDLASYVDGDKFLAKAAKYNCLDLVRKAMLTCDTQIFNNSTVGLDTIQYPIAIDEETAASLRARTVYETIFEQKNLWEVFLQSGYYKHAIPRLDFATDGTDRFALKYQQLGVTKKKADESNKITVFNSRNLSEFFTQYDSYVTNLFSPQNVVDEWGVVKTSDSNYLVSNNTAEIHAKYPLEEIIEFDLTYRGVTASALNMIFEEAIYSILTPSIDVRPSKACALYYKLGDTKIVGLNYAPPSVNNDAPYALKTILSALFGIDASGDIQFNDIRYHIKYRTQDSLRVSQVRPDLQNFMKNSSYEKYPHHEQFFGQQDKIIDSERFTANLFGKLIRVGNAVYQRQEYADAGSEKESGDLVEINGEPYYVTATENEYYADIILQKVTYSKNFNQLANIVTIPSEPRFYEVSERSQVRREVRLMDFLLLTTKQNVAAASPTFINNSKWRDIAKSLIFADGSFALPNFAYTRFNADKLRSHNGIQTNKLFPSSEITRTGNNSVRPKDSSDHRDVIVPLLHFPLKNAIVFEWDMDDNFKAGDSIDTTISGTGNTKDDAYYSMQSVRYCDVMGRADLFGFRLFNKTNWTIAQARRLPFAESGDFVPTESESAFYLSDSLSIGLDKDNREALSFNYQINLLHEDATFVTYSNLFGQKSNRLKMCLLNTEASLFDDGVAMTARTIIADNVTYSLVNTSRNAIEIRITRPANISASAVKSIVLYEEEGASKYAYIAKNVGDVADTEKFNSWWLYPVFTQ